MGVCSWGEKVEEEIHRTLPAGPGERNRQVFELARALKAMSQFADANPRDLEPIVRHWHKSALPVIRTLEFEETWLDFLKSWPNVKFPKGTGPLDEALRRAVAAPPPAQVMRFDHPACRLLASLCRELQRPAGDSHFFLSCRTAGKLIGVSFKTAARWLELFVLDRILLLHEKGTQQTRRASRYFYIADSDASEIDPTTSQ